MKLLWFMTVSGSLMVVFYILSKVFMKDRVSAKWKYRILKAALFFYLVPVQALKTKWTQLYNIYFADGNQPVVRLSEDIKQVAEGRMPRYSVNYTWKYIYCAVVIIILAVLVSKMLVYVKERRTVLKHPAGRNDGKTEANIVRQQDRLGIKRKISCRVCSGSLDSFTIGAFRPVIVLDDSGCDGEERELIIRHELIHIKSWDGLVKILGMIAAAVHFFNPLAYYLFYELSAASEFACDEKVVSGMDGEEMKRYCCLLLGMAQRKRKGLYRIPFKGGKNGVKERIEMMLNSKNRKKGWQVFAGAVLSLAVILVSSVTTFAYEPMTVFEMDDSWEEIEQGHGDVDRVFVVDGYESTGNYFDTGLPEMSFTDSDAYFVDEQGNRYDVAENAARVLCNHNFVSGTYSKHVKNGAGCTVYIYNAERCTICGTVQVKDLYSKTSYPTCPH